MWYWISGRVWGALLIYLLFPSGLLGATFTIGLTGSPNPVTAGNTLTYTITVINSSQIFRRPLMSRHPSGLCSVSIREWAKLRKQRRRSRDVFDQWAREWPILQRYRHGHRAERGHHYKHGDGYVFRQLARTRMSSQL